jgi:hypothetical protein
VVLDFFFVVLDLLFDPIGSKCEGMVNIRIPIDRDELVFVFRVSQDFDSNLAFSLAVKIHRYRDGDQAIEEVEQLLGLVLELLVGIVGQMPMPGGDCHLHRWTSCSVPGVPFVDATGVVIPLLVEVDGARARKGAESTSTHHLAAMERSGESQKPDQNDCTPGSGSLQLTDRTNRDSAHPRMGPEFEHFVLDGAG